MAETPKKATEEVNFNRPVIKRALKDAEQKGFEEGLEKGRREILDFLEFAYMRADNRPDRGTTEAKALLVVAGEASEHIKKLMRKKGSRRR